jgi:hypothetical protein
MLYPFNLFPCLYLISSLSNYTCQTTILVFENVTRLYWILNLCIKIAIMSKYKSGQKGNI